MQKGATDFGVIMITSPTVQTSSIHPSNTSEGLGRLRYYAFLTLFVICGALVHTRPLSWSRAGTSGLGLGYAWESVVLFSPSESVQGLWFTSAFASVFTSIPVRLVPFLVHQFQKPNEYMWVCVCIYIYTHLYMCIACLFFKTLAWINMMQDLGNVLGSWRPSRAHFRYASRAFARNLSLRCATKRPKRHSNSPKTLRSNAQAACRIL